MAPCFCTLKSEYWLCERPEAFGAVIFTTGTPFAAASMPGLLPAWAAASGTMPPPCAIAAGGKVNVLMSM